MNVVHIRGTDEQFRELINSLMNTNDNSLVVLASELERMIELDADPEDVISLDDIDATVAEGEAEIEADDDHC